MKPSDLCEITITPVNIGISLITKLEIDLTHINFGLDNKTKKYRVKRRSSFSEVEIANVFSLLEGFFLNPIGKKEDYLYFALEIEYQKKVYMLAFCINKNSIQTAGIITFYKLKSER